MAFRKAVIPIGLICLLIIGLFTFFSLNGLYVSAQTGTSVSGIIETDTIWTQTDSPYNLVGNLLINTGVTLNVEPGVTISLNEYYIMVNGTFFVKGQTGNIIRIDNGEVTYTIYSSEWNESTETGCLLEYVTSTSVTFNGHNGKVFHSFFSNGVLNGFSVLSENTFLSNPVNSEKTIVNNLFNKSSLISGSNNPVTGFYNIYATIIENYFNDCGISIFGGSHLGSSTISNNTITNPSGIGILSLGEALITNNWIYNCQTGIEMEGYKPVMGEARMPAPIIQNNFICNNQLGIAIGSIPAIENNTFYLNNIGAHQSSGGYIKLIGNNFLNSSSFSFQNTHNIDVNASSNWWGTVSLQEIEGLIYDYNDDSVSGELVFLPILLEPNSMAPEIPTFTIQAQSSSGGSINPTGNVIVNFGDNQSFTVTPNTGYHIDSVLIDGVSASSPYTFINVISSGHNISALFAPDPTPTPSPSPTSTTVPTETPNPSSTTSPTPTQTATNTPSPIPNEQDNNQFLLSTEFLMILIVVVVLVVIVVIGVLIWKKF